MEHTLLSHSVLTFMYGTYILLSHSVLTFTEETYITVTFFIELVYGTYIYVTFRTDIRIWKIHCCYILY